MQEALDIYIKLLIAIISFIAPLLINLLSIFSDGIAVKKRKFNEYEVQTTKLLKDEINSGTSNVTALISESSKAFEQRKTESNKQLNLLDPKKQIIRIFPTFFYSLVLVIINRVLADKWFDCLLNIKEPYYHIVLAIFLVASMYFAVRGVLILKSVVWAIVDVKQEIALNIEKEKLQSKTEAVTSTKDKPQSKTDSVNSTKDK